MRDADSKTKAKRENLLVQAKGRVLVCVARGSARKHDKRERERDVLLCLADRNTRAENKNQKEREGEGFVVVC